MVISTRKIKDLVDKFKNEKVWARSEDHIQTFFTVKLLEILDWKSAYLRINQGQDVKTGKKPDIVLHSSGSTLLVIESKDALKKDILDGRYHQKTFVDQLFGYCEAEGIFWGVLTNFIEWRVYSIYQDRLYKNKKYAFHDLLWPEANKQEYIDLLSDEGLAFFHQIEREDLILKKGRLDDDPVYYPKQEEIKDRFFRDLKRWRKSLRAFLNNKYKPRFGLDQVDLITQKILDRLIFIDYCSDNGIITQDLLHAILQSKGRIHVELNRIFNDMDEKFNTELFSPDDFYNVEIDDDIIKPIIRELADTDFKNLSVHIMGEVYDNYLGEILRSSKRGIKVEKEKAGKKKKSQGIYYTPDYIVNYIVENTVGVLLNKCRTISEVEKIRVLDPACGSGSFLIRVFDEFLKHYRRIDDKPLLEFETRKSILQNNIYGVDLDERAIEIAKLNLLVKALEGSARLDLSGRKLLPNLKLNIRCGNSLISGELTNNKTDLLWLNNEKDIQLLRELRKNFHAEREDQKQASIFNQIRILEETVNINLNDNLSKYFKNAPLFKPLNYSVIFPEVFSKGGFSCIIGNPPYIDSETMTKEQPETRAFIAKHFEFTKGNWDIYIAFLERAFKLVDDEGYWSFITPDKWIAKPFGESLRKGTIGYIREILKVGRDVFPDANVDAIVSLYRKKESRKVKAINFSKGKLNLLSVVPKNAMAEPYDYDFLFSKSLPILLKVEKLSKGTTIQFVCDNACATSDAYKLKPFIEDLKQRDFNADKYYKVINTGTIGKYISRWGIKEMTYLDNKYLAPVVRKRVFESEFGNSYGRKANKAKLIIKGLTLLDNCLDLNGEIIPGKTTLIVFANDSDQLKYLSAVLNSKLAFFYISQKYASFSYNQGINFTKDMINGFPVPTPSLNIKTKMISYVDRVIKIQSEYYVEGSIEKKEGLKMNIDTAEYQINKLVYDLYGISDNERKIIDESSK